MVVGITAAAAAAAAALAPKNGGGAPCHATAAPLTLMTARGRTELVMQHLGIPSAMMRLPGVRDVNRWDPGIHSTLDASVPMSRRHQSQRQDSLVGRNSTIRGLDVTEVHVDGMTEMRRRLGVRPRRSARESEA